LIEKFATYRNAKSRGHIPGRSPFMFIERFGFSASEKVAINAPFDLVWEAILNIEHYPSVYSSCCSAKRIEDKYSGHRRRQTETSDDSLEIQLMNSKWEIVRVSTLENQQYKFSVAVTQMSLNENKRSITLSTSKVLGATGSLKLVLERKDNETDGNAESNWQSCEVTAILSLIPYKIFVELLGIMCCICLLKWRAKMAMDCDLEDLKQACEVRAKQRVRASTSN